MSLTVEAARFLESDDLVRLLPKPSSPGSFLVDDMIPFIDVIFFPLLYEKPLFEHLDLVPGRRL